MEELVLDVEIEVDVLLEVELVLVEELVEVVKAAAGVENLISANPVAI